jgi:hypothetical protein
VCAEIARDGAHGRTQTQALTVRDVLGRDLTYAQLRRAVLAAESASVRISLSTT